LQRIYIYIYVILEDTKDSTKRLLDLRNKFSKVIGYKINIFAYTSTELTKKEIRKTISFTITPPAIKYPGINLTKEVKPVQ
jgi:hypothetical protein